SVEDVERQRGGTQDELGERAIGRLLGYHPAQSVARRDGGVSVAIQRSHAARDHRVGLVVRTATSSGSAEYRRIRSASRCPIRYALSSTAVIEVTGGARRKLLHIQRSRIGHARCRSSPATNQERRKTMEETTDIKKRKLILNRETVMPLQQDQLAQVYG